MHSPEFDIFNLSGPIVALVYIEGRMSIPPDVVYQVVIDPAKLSPSREYIHLDQRTQVSDAHGWFAIESLKILEVLGECTQEKQTQVPSYYARTKEQRAVNE